MKWYTIHCPECKWETPIVSEEVAEKFRSQLGVCQDCKEKRNLKVEFEYREVITNTLRGQHGASRRH